MSEQVIFLGESFEVADRIGLMPLMRFAKTAQAGVDSSDMAGLAAMYDLIQQCLTDPEWPRFEAHCDRERADGDQLMTFVREVITLISARPTSRSSGSSDGPSSTARNSEVDLSSEVVTQLVRRGRPDLGTMVTLAREASA